MKEIKLTQNQVTLVDDKDYEYLNQYKWFYTLSPNHNTGYAARRKKINGVNKTIFMHRIIMQTEDGKFTDHINGNGIDNRRINLRICTIAQNTANSSKHKDILTEYKGLYWIPIIDKWRATISPNGKSVILGHYKNKIDAAMKYDKAARYYYGEFAKTNFPEWPYGIMDGI